MTIVVMAIRGICVKDTLFPQTVQKIAHGSKTECAQMNTGMIIVSPMQEAADLHLQLVLDAKKRAGFAKVDRHRISSKAECKTFTFLIKPAHGY